jgi:hypothetical protein
MTLVSPIHGDALMYNDLDFLRPGIRSFGGA